MPLQRTEYKIIVEEKIFHEKLISKLLVIDVVFKPLHLAQVVHFVNVIPGKIFLVLGFPVAAVFETLSINRACQL